MHTMLLLLHRRAVPPPPTSCMTPCFQQHSSFGTLSWPFCIPALTPTSHMSWFQQRFLESHSVSALPHSNSAHASRETPQTAKSGRSCADDAPRLHHASISSSKERTHPHLEGCTCLAHSAVGRIDERLSRGAAGRSAQTARQVAGVSSASCSLPSCAGQATRPPTAQPSGAVSVG